jgi:quinol monooxygenase YgiN
MIRHIVMWKLKDDAGVAARSQNARRVKEWLEACADIVPGILRFEAVLAQDGWESTCDVMLYAEFASRAALEAYNAHPQHQLLKARVAPLRDVRHCFDHEL